MTLCRPVPPGRRLLALHPAVGALAALLVASAAIAAPAPDDAAPAPDDAAPLAEPATPTTRALSLPPPPRSARAGKRRRSGRSDAITVFGRRQREALQPGSATTIDSKQLERHRYDDVGRLLRDKPGNTVRDEEGWGLRPNIGMRGANPERSARIALMEDGVPAAPAPYAAPAAYYFPLMLRMDRVEVLKGPAAIRYGPNAIGGALNLVGAGLPDGERLDLEIAGGNTMYGRGLARWGRSFGPFAILLEGALVRSDGFKRIVDGKGDDTGADAGFLRRDAGLVLGARVGSGARTHEISLRLGYGDEDSHETYLGLSRADFDRDPTQRYLASANDRMQWRHVSARLRHVLTAEGAAGTWTLRTSLYANRLQRVWDKVDGFAGGPEIASVLRAPTSGSNAVFMAVLRGAQDSLSPAETVVLGRNDRTFLATGLSSELSYEGEALGLRHELLVGARVHHDDALRLSTSHGVLVSGGKLVDDGKAEVRTVEMQSSVLAISAWAQDTAIWKALRLTAGVRVEQMASEAEDPVRKLAKVDSSTTAVMPGLGAVVELRPGLVALAGVFKGFAAVAPGQPSSVDPEQAWNVDGGLRWTGKATRAELIGFAGFYDNLVGTCSSSSGCSAAQLDTQFNGGRALALGVEASAGALLRAPGEISVPVGLSVTAQRTTFQQSFSSDNPAWGEVTAGDVVPYVPTLQVALSSGLRRGPLDVSIAGRYVARVADVPGVLADLDDTQTTDAVMQLDAAASWRFGRFGSAFVQAQNLTGAMPVVSLRPFGARPTLPRLIVVGWRL